MRDKKALYTGTSLIERVRKTTTLLRTLPPTFGETLSEHMTNLDITNESLAEKLGVVTSGTNVKTTTYEYVDGGYGTNSTTPLVKSITQPGICFDYAYDNRGNIISEKRYAPGTAEANKLETTYVYDGLGQLIRVNDPHENATWVYSYDRGGNILSKTKYAFTTGALGSVVEDIPYTYGDSNWKDKLTAYNGVGITYDEIGNPLFDGERTYTWGAGRQLRHISMPATGSNGSDGKTKEIDFIYDHNGMRTGKIVSENGKVEITEYTLHGKLITHLTKRVVDLDGIESSEELHFFYDAQSRPAFVEYDGTKYRYIHNLQGDIVAIVDAAGNRVVEYKYDAWGGLLSITGLFSNSLGEYNPFCYRGYAYDGETRLYYLRSRYYNGIENRFINSDELIDADRSTLATNVFAYCKNRSVVAVDENGYSAEAVDSVVAVAIVVLHIVQAVAAEATLYLNRKRAQNAVNAALGKSTVSILSTVGRKPYQESVKQGESTLIWFYRMVNTGQPMDYKNENRRPWWAFFEKFYFRGKMITFEVYGNVNYGYVGKELGIPDAVLYAGGGYAAIASGGDTSGGAECFFDSREDHDNIAWGISIHKKTWGF